jgi:hypothetical protein
VIVVVGRASLDDVAVGGEGFVAAADAIVVGDGARAAACVEEAVVVAACVAEAGVACSSPPLGFAARNQRPCSFVLKPCALATSCDSSATSGMMALSCVSIHLGG